MIRRSLLLGLALAAVTSGWLPGTAARADEAAEILPDIPLGKEDAPVTVIEYASYTCPHCADFHDGVFPDLKRDYIDTGKVKFILREVYFDKYGLWAGMVAQCGGAPKYYGIAGMLFNGQRDWIGDGKDATIAANLRKIGLKAGLTGDQIETCLNDQKHAQAMVASFQKNAQADGIDATPSFVIDGKKYGNMSYADFKKLLDEKLGG
ncbi:DsbA family protein [Paenirhodobacter sp.]|uniref:DsbA family protein n=1 Tax=Paenirhodobacter sp. TaxID=1965326 RepID=UPI003B3D33F6